MRKIIDMLIDKKENRLFRLFKKNICYDEKLQMATENANDSSFSKINENKEYWIIWRQDKETGRESIDALCIDEYLAIKELWRLKINKPGSMFTLKSSLQL